MGNRWRGAKFSRLRGEQLVEVVHQSAAPLEPLVVRREPPDETLVQAGRRPLAELGAARAHAELSTSFTHLSNNSSPSIGSGAPVSALSEGALLGDAPTSPAGGYPRARH